MPSPDETLARVEALIAGLEAIDSAVERRLATLSRDRHPALNGI